MLVFCPRSLTQLGGVALLAAMASPAPAAAQMVAAPVSVVITDKGCEPAAVTVNAGKSVFKIKNASRRAVEWEILKGVNVVEERENIIPGFVQTLTATLDAGDYTMTCGLLSNPKGILTVAAVDAAPAPPSPMDLVGPLSEYKLYVTRETDTLVAETRRFTDAVKAGKLDEAKALYAPTRQHYERIEPVAELFSDLDGSMDAREDDFEKKADDPAFTGFHRIEKEPVLGWDDAAGLEPVADKLMADVTELQTRLATLTITPKSMVGGAADLIEEVASKKISGEEDRYSRTDLWDFQANVDGAQKIVDLLNPLVQRQKPELVIRVADNFGKVDDILKKYRLTPDGGFVSYEKLSPEDRNGLRGPVTRAGGGPLDLSRHARHRVSAMTDAPTAGLPVPPPSRRGRAGLAGPPDAPGRGSVPPAAPSASARPAQRSRRSFRSASRTDTTAERQPFYGSIQSGIVNPQPAAALLVAFDVLATSRPGLVRLMKLLTERGAFLTQGGATPETDPKLPPADSGLLGPTIIPDDLTMTVAVGASLFDDRFGLAPYRPRSISWR